MVEYRFTLEVAGPDCSDDAFSEWVAAQTSACGHATRNGHHYIHFTQPAASLQHAVKQAVGMLTEWSELRIVGFSSTCSNSGALATA